MDLWGMISQYINLPATMAAAGIAWLLQIYVLPSPQGAEPHVTVAGSFWARIQPLFAPIMATGFCLAAEWDKSLSAMDVIRGINSGIASEYLLRVVFKSILGK